ncbi:hypothetical protein KAH37_02150 [bacterium]|nr:hypothetical protein [bacterium]
MQQTKILLTLLVILLVSSCSKPVESAGKWRVLDKYDYDLSVDPQTLFSDIDAIERVLLMPMSYLEQDNTPVSFEQTVEYQFAKEREGKPALYTMSEQSEGFSDGTGAFHIIYGNNKNEGWEMIWKDNFLYRKLLGGKFARTFSMGEHEFYRETQFKMLSEIYAVFRDHAKISGSRKMTVSGVACREVTIDFVPSKQNRSPLPVKKYLQNSAGVEEMKNDKLITQLSKKGFSNINGTLALCVTEDFTPMWMKFHLEAMLMTEKTTITIDGERTVFKKSVEKIQTPEYTSEYHRRTMDATKNIMK